jgi:hypothetical protein
MTWRLAAFVTVAVIVTLVVGVAFVIDPWPIVAAYLGTLAILGPLITWAVMRHRSPPRRREAHPTTVNITYNVLQINAPTNSADEPRSVGGAVYRQAPGVIRAIDAAHPREDHP